jgi:hypothetical protein
MQKMPKKQRLLTIFFNVYLPAGPAGPRHGRCGQQCRTGEVSCRLSTPSEEGVASRICKRVVPGSICARDECADTVMCFHCCVAQECVRATGIARRSALWASTSRIAPWSLLLPRLLLLHWLLHLLLCCFCCCCHHCVTRQRHARVHTGSNADKAFYGNICLLSIFPSIPLSLCLCAYRRCT